MDKLTFLIGKRLRDTRKGQGRSIHDVATKANVSVATLSRIETNKQGVDLSLFLSLTRILKCRASDLLDMDPERPEPSHQVAEQIKSLDRNDRVQLWRRLATEVRNRGVTARATQIRHLAVQVEELLAQLDFVRAEVEAVNKRLRQ